MTEDRDVLGVCHDAGAANYLAALASAPGAPGLIVAAAGPAVGVLRGAGVEPLLLAEDTASVGRLVDDLRPPAVLIGTSLGGSLERLFASAAAERGVPTVGLVDWWANFGGRFSSVGTRDLAFLPTLVAVPDDDGVAGAVADGVPRERVVAVGNPYWDTLAALSDERRDARRRKVRGSLGVAESDTVVLVISGNLRNLGLGLGYEESDLWRALAPLPDVTPGGGRVRWMVRPHPLEPVDEFRRMLAGFSVDALVPEGMPPVDALLAADAVVGMCSTMLLEAALLGRAVVSLQPGRDDHKLRFLRIFEHLGVPQVVRAQDAPDVVRALLDRRIGPPDLARLPEYVADGRAAERFAAAIPVTGRAA